MTWHKQPPLLERITPKIRTDGPLIASRPDLGPCWPWTGMTVDGYGRVKVEGKGRGVHRVVFQLACGPIPDGMTLDHLCHTLHPACAGGHCAHRVCCNPRHLEIVTHSENARRRPQPSTCKRGHDLTDPSNLKRVSHGRTQRQCLACIRFLYAERQRRAA